ncbi:MAG: hypothetical protein GF331_00825 [Chitinivibrionales bacterium]|nr:hypothetical protein [Chitinivibrionales bacterium]
MTAIVLVPAVLQAAQLCEATVNCLPMWGGDTLVLPDNVVTLAPSFEHCSPTYVDESHTTGSVDTISVMFVIDHSMSMSFMDSTASRYRLTEQLIDSLHAYSPASEVGIVVFSNQLLHNYQNDPYYTPLDTSQGWPDSYIPLTRLDTTVDGLSATEKLKAAIELSPTERDRGQNRKLVNGYYGLTGRRDGSDTTVLTGYNGTTDISLAFEAARKAFASARYAPEKQFIVLLSDGIAQHVDAERRPYQDDYIEGAGVPTTYTAFWINPLQPIPWQIDSMTASIRANGYSSNNVNSTVWKTRGAEDDLVQQLLDMTMGSAFNIIPSTPVELRVNGKNAISFDSTHAYFDWFFPLTGEFTQFDVTFTYHYAYPWDRDSTRTNTVVIQRRSGAPLPDGITTRCWEQGTIGLYDAGAELTSVSDDQHSLQVRFYPSPDSPYPVDEAVVHLSTDSAGDSLTLNTARLTDYFGVTFERTYGPAQIDAVLQNLDRDSIVIIYRNPDVPLDTIRVAFPVAGPRDIAVRRAYYLDQDANGYPDVIRVVQGDHRLTVEEDSIIQPYIHLQTTRGVSIKTVVPSAYGFDIVLNEPGESSGEAPYTGVYANERLYIDSVPNLPASGAFPATDVAIADSMAPAIVSASYWDRAAADERDTMVVVFSEAVDETLSVEPFTLNRWPDIASYSLRLSAVTVDSATVTFFVVPIVGQQVPQLGDSIWIDEREEVADLLGNPQDNPENVRRLLDYYLLYRIISAVYLDMDGDGRIDVVRVETDRVPDDSLLAALYDNIDLPEYRNFSFSADDLVATGSGFEIHVTQPEGTMPFTGVDERDVLRVGYTVSGNNGMVRPTSVPISDSLKPVLVSARFLPGAVTSAGDTVPDTLVVRFSEPVEEINDSTPFRFYDMTGDSEYTVVVVPVSQDGEWHTFEVVSKDNPFPQTGDSLWIDPEANISDPEGNVQDQDNPRRPLEVGEYRIGFEVHVAGNPFNLGNPEIPAPVRNRFGITESHGQPIVIVPHSQLPDGTQGQATVTILDVVGNVVVDEQKCRYIESSGAFVYVWNGTNRQGRQVGIGTYLALVTVKTNTTDVHRVKLGVTRR